MTMDMNAKIFVTLKKSVLDPQGVAVKSALETMGYKGVLDVRLGKYLEVRMNGQDRTSAEKELKEMCDKLLANPVIEEYRYEIQKD